MATVEQPRLDVLRLSVLDTEAGPIFDDLVALAGQIAGVDMAMVTLVDEHRLWFLASIGVDVPSCGRDVALCDHVVRSGRELDVPDTRVDPRFADNPEVAAGRVVFYSGFPLVIAGKVIGTLCVTADRPVELDEVQRRGLRTLAQQVMTQLELRRLTVNQAAELDRRTAAEAALAESRRQYQLLAEHSSDIISRHAADGRVTYVSPCVSRLLGYDPTQAIGSDPTRHVHPEDAGGLRIALDAVARGESQTATVRSRHADGTWRWLEVTLSPLLDDTGKLVEIYSAAREVTDRIQAVEAAARSADFTRAVLDSVAVGIVACDAEGRLTLFNHSTRDWHGVAADDAVRSQDWATHFDLYRPDGVTVLPRDEVPLAVALSEGEVHDVEVVIAPHGLPARLVRCEGRALRDADGAVKGAVVAMTDITATREAERSLRRAHDALRGSTDALRRSEAQFRSAFENGPMAMCRLDQAGNVVQANPAMRRLLARTGSTLLHRKLTALAASSDRERLSLALATAGGAPTAAEVDYLEIRMLRPDGSTLWCELAISAASDLTGDDHLLVLLGDIDSRKRREVDLQHRVSRDDLTGVANRAEFHRRLATLLDPAAGNNPVALLFLDLDGFKAVNDSAGHSVGDEVLVEVAQRLRALVRAEDLVARLGGDEFVLVRQDRDGNVAARTSALVTRVQQALEQPFASDAGPQRIGVSVGSTIATPGEDPSVALARADQAMYDDKRRRKNPQPRTPGGALPLPRQAERPQD